MTDGGCEVCARFYLLAFYCLQNLEHQIDVCNFILQSIYTHESFEILYDGFNNNLFILLLVVVTYLTKFCRFVECYFYSL
jgi:hypothetical protein